MLEAPLRRTFCHMILLHNVAPSSVGNVWLHQYNWFCSEVLPKNGESASPSQRTSRPSPDRTPRFKSDVKVEKRTDSLYEH